MNSPLNILLPLSSLGTKINGGYYNKIKRLHDWGMIPYEERSLKLVFQYMQNVCVKNNIL